MASRLVQYEVERCWECPHYRTAASGEWPYCMASPTVRDIDTRADEIPDWCPLPLAPSEPEPG